jgi:hypothetical protein
MLSKPALKAAIKLGGDGSTLESFVFMQCFILPYHPVLSVHFPEHKKTIKVPIITNKLRNAP